MMTKDDRFQSPQELYHHQSTNTWNEHFLQSPVKNATAKGFSALIFAYKLLKFNKKLGN